MPIFGRSRENFRLAREQERMDLSFREIELPKLELKCKIYWDGGWYERGSRGNNSNHVLNIVYVLNKSEGTSTNQGMSRSTLEVGYLVASGDDDVDLIVFGKVVNTLKPTSAKRIRPFLNSAVPVMVRLSECFADEDRGLPDRYDTHVLLNQH